MAVTKNTVYIPELADDATPAAVEEVKRMSLAMQTNQKETIAYEQEEGRKATSKHSEAKAKVAGQEAKNDSQNNPSAEQVVVGEALMTGTPALELASRGKEIIDAIGSDNPSEAADVIRAQSEGLISTNARSLEDMFKDMKIDSGPWQSANSKSDERGFELASSDIPTAAVAELDAATATITKEVKTTEVGRKIADEAALQRAIALENSAQYQAQLSGPGGLGGGRGAMAAQRNLESMKDGPSYKLTGEKGTV